MFALKFSRLAAVLMSLVCLTTADTEDYQCESILEYDASVKGTVSSPFYGKRLYHNNLKCEYIIKAPEGHRIKITLKDFDIEPSDGCEHDSLLVYGKDGILESFYGIFCGQSKPRPIVSAEEDNEIHLILFTDDMIAGKGFLLEYESGPDLEICEPGYEECRNRNCFKPEQKCDGVDDCIDGTDEEECNFPPVLQPKECGVQAIPPNTIYSESPDRMVGGEAAVPNSWPWQVSLREAGSEPSAHFCGGTLINSQWVLTAAHCVDGREENMTFQIVMGAHSKFTETSYEQIRYDAKIISYPDLEGTDLSRFDLAHDVALIKLNAPVSFNDGVQPACLPELGWVAKPGWLCYATGWGETRGSGNNEVLKQTVQVVQSTANCSFNEPAQICVEMYQQAACHGDSGGPLHCKLGDKWFVFGSTSFITKVNLISGICAGPGAQSVYASSADKAEWIRTIVEEYS